MDTPAKVWRVIVIPPDGHRQDRDEGGYYLPDGFEPPPQKIADTLAEIAWRIAYDLANETTKVGAHD